MTAQSRRTVRSWAAPVLMTVMAVGITVEAALLVPVIKKQSEQAAAGNDARLRQCAIAPVSEKQQLWFRDHGVITAQDLRMYRRGAPSPQECAAIRAQK